MLNHVIAEDATIPSAISISQGRERAGSQDAQLQETGKTASSSIAVGWHLACTSPEFDLKTEKAYFRASRKKNVTFTVIFPL